MISKTMETAINDQMQKEFYSSYLYLAMSAYLESKNLCGMAHWMDVQSSEERGHAMKFMKYLQDRSGAVKLGAIEQPPAKWKSPMEAFEQSLGHERMITASIGKINDLAAKENDPATQVMLQWFISEQVEEEKNAELNVQQFKMIEAHETAVYILDHQMGKRGKG